MIRKIYLSNSLKESLIFFNISFIFKIYNKGNIEETFVKGNLVFVFPRLLTAVVLGYCHRNLLQTDVMTCTGLKIERGVLSALLSF